MSKIGYLSRVFEAFYYLAVTRETLQIQDCLSDPRPVQEKERLWAKQRKKYHSNKCTIVIFLPEN